MTWAEYLTRYTVGETGRTTAERLGITESNVSRWKKGGQRPEARHVVTFAREYGRPVLEALVEAGYITATEARQRPAAAPSLDRLADDDLLAEVARRLRATRLPAFDPYASAAAATEPVDMAERRAPTAANRDDEAQPRQQAARKGETPPEDWDPR